jgi:hypothetical protein
VSREFRSRFSVLISPLGRGSEEYCCFFAALVDGVLDIKCALSDVIPLATALRGGCPSTASPWFRACFAFAVVECSVSAAVVAGRRWSIIRTEVEKNRPLTLAALGHRVWWHTDAAAGLGVDFGEPGGEVAVGVRAGFG